MTPEQQRLNRIYRHLHLVLKEPSAPELRTNVSNLYQLPLKTTQNLTVLANTYISAHEQAIK